MKNRNLKKCPNTYENNNPHNANETKEIEHRTPTIVGVQQQSRHQRSEYGTDLCPRIGERSDFAALLQRHPGGQQCRARRKNHTLAQPDDDAHHDQCHSTACLHTNGRQQCEHRRHGHASDQRNFATVPRGQHSARHMRYHIANVERGQNESLQLFVPIKVGFRWLNHFFKLILIYSCVFFLRSFAHFTCSGRRRLVGTFEGTL